MKKALMILATLILAACGGGGGGGVGLGGSGEPSNVLVAGQTPPAATPAPAPAAAGVPATPDCTAAFWGDSIGGMTQGQLDPAIVVHGRSVAGSTAQMQLVTFLQDPLAEPIIILEFGTNESNSGQGVQPALGQMIDRAKSLGRTVVLTGLPHEEAGDLALHAQNDFVIRSLAQSPVLYADWPSVSYAVGDLMPDGVHPAAAYQKRLADALSVKILANCKPISQ